MNDQRVPKGGMVLSTGSFNTMTSDAILDARTVRGTVSDYTIDNKKAMILRPKCCRANTLFVGDNIGLRLSGKIALLTDPSVRRCPRFHSQVTKVRVA